MNHIVRIPAHAPGLLEAVLQRMFLGHLAKLEVRTGGQCWFWRQNVALAQTPDHPIKLGVSGQADIGGVVLGRSWGIEVKRDGQHQSQDQRDYQVRFERAGGRYYVARSLDQALVPVCEALGLKYDVEGRLA